MYKSNIEENRIVGVSQMDALRDVLKVSQLQQKRVESFKVSERRMIVRFERGEKERRRRRGKRRRCCLKVVELNRICATS